MTVDGGKTKGSVKRSIGVCFSIRQVVAERSARYGLARFTSVRVWVSKDCARTVLVNNTPTRYLREIPCTFGPVIGSLVHAARVARRWYLGGVFVAFARIDFTYGGDRYLTV
jgi:hypothetical protein